MEQVQGDRCTARSALLHVPNSKPRQDLRAKSKQTTAAAHRKPPFDSTSRTVGEVAR